MTEPCRLSASPGRLIGVLTALTPGLAKKYGAGAKGHGQAKKK
jgi:hypothetical protein